MEYATDVRRSNFIEQIWGFELPDGLEPGEYTVKYHGINQKKPFTM